MKMLRCLRSERRMYAKKRAPVPVKEVWGGPHGLFPPEHLGKASLRLYPAGEVVHTDHNKNGSRFDEGNHKDGAVSLPVG